MNKLLCTSFITQKWNYKAGEESLILDKWQIPHLIRERNSHVIENNHSSIHSLNNMKWTFQYE